MKKLVYGTLFLALVGVGFVGCKKENIALNDQNSIKQTKEGTRYYAENGILVFNSVEDYETSVSDLIEEDEENFVNSILGLDYTSYTEELANQGSNATDLIEDNVLSAILNKERLVQIANYVYRINLQSEKVFVLPVTEMADLADLVNEDKGNKNIRQFSTGDDVIYLAESGDPGEKCGGISGGSYPCYANAYQGQIVATLGNGNVWRLNPGVKFFRAGVYFRLSSLYEIWAYANSSSTSGGTKINNLNGLFTVEMFCKWSEGWYKRRPCNSGSIGTQSPGFYYSSTSGQYQKTFYSGTRNLNGYYFFVQGRVKYPNGSVTTASPYGGRNINSPY